MSTSTLSDAADTPDATYIHTRGRGDRITTMRRKVSITTSVTAAERDQLFAEAADEGVTLATLIYRRVLNQPDARRHPGRPRTPEHPDAEEQLPLTG